MNQFFPKKFLVSTNVWMNTVKSVIIIKSSNYHRKIEENSIYYLCLSVFVRSNNFSPQILKVMVIKKSGLSCWTFNNSLAQHRYNVPLKTFWKFDDFTTILGHLSFDSDKTVSLKTIHLQCTPAPY